MIIVEKYRNLSTREVHFQAKLQNGLPEFLGHGNTELEAVKDLRSKIECSLSKWKTNTVVFREADFQ